MGGRTKSLHGHITCGISRHADRQQGRPSTLHRINSSTSAQRHDPALHCDRKMAGLWDCTCNCSRILGFRSSGRCFCAALPTRPYTSMYTLTASARTCAT